MMNTKTEARPIKKGGYSHAKADARRDRRRQEAEARQRQHDALSLEEKVAKCNLRRGASARETERLTGKKLKDSLSRVVFNLKPWVSPIKK